MVLEIFLEEIKEWVWKVLEEKGCTVNLEHYSGQDLQYLGSNIDVEQVEVTLNETGYKNIRHAQDIYKFSFESPEGPVISVLGMIIREEQGDWYMGSEILDYEFRFCEQKEKIVRYYTPVQYNESVPILIK